MTLTYQCPCCGAGLKFDADTQLFKCEFCLSEHSEVELKETDAFKKAEEIMAQSEEFCNHMNEYLCSQCGAEITADENTVADICPYCHSPVVLSGRLAGQRMPTKIVPFKFSREEAIKQFLDFAKKKWFVPKDFTEKEQIEKIAGIYYPFWVTDADTDSQFNAVGTKVRTWTSGDYRYKETSYYNIHRRGDIHFEDISQSAYSQADKNMLEGILPFPASAQMDFDMSYLSGFLGKKRDIEREDLEGGFKEKVISYGNEVLRRTVQGYSTVSIKNSNAKIKVCHWDYSLMPIWLLTYKSKKGERYTFAMNGHTGKIYGELPISPERVTVGGIITGVLSAIAAAIIGGAIFL
jgi:DNA-directed RNA polymerase subunit RPC12/RpoP